MPSALRTRLRASAALLLLGLLLPGSLPVPSEVGVAAGEPGVLATLWSGQAYGASITSSSSGMSTAVADTGYILSSRPIVVEAFAERHSAGPVVLTGVASRVDIQLDRSLASARAERIDLAGPAGQVLSFSNVVASTAVDSVSAVGRVHLGSVELNGVPLLADFQPPPNTQLVLPWATLVLNQQAFQLTGDHLGLNVDAIVVKRTYDPPFIPEEPPDDIHLIHSHGDPAPIAAG